MTTAERVQAIVAGPPAWARRRKRIEDLSAQVLEAHREGRDEDVNKGLVELTRLVEQHNAYYPIEANLPLDFETSRLMDGGVPWKPMPAPTLESLLQTEREAAPASLEWFESPGALSVTFDATALDGALDRFTLRLDEEALSCVGTRRTAEIVRVPTESIEEIVAGPTLQVVTLDTKTIPFPFRLDEALVAALAGELGARLRTMRAAASNYRGE